MAVIIELIFRNVYNFFFIFLIMTAELSIEQRRTLDLIVGAAALGIATDLDIGRAFQSIDPRIKLVESGGRLQNCFSYALDFQEGISGEAIDLIAKEIVFSINGSPGDIIWYFRKGIINHAGKLISSDVVRSKWGGDPVFDHPMFSLPDMYGDVVRYSSIPDSKLVERYASSFFGFQAKEPFHLVC